MTRFTRTYKKGPVRPDHWQCFFFLCSTLSARTEMWRGKGRIGNGFSASHTHEGLGHKRGGLENLLALAKKVLGKGERAKECEHAWLKNGFSALVQSQRKRGEPAANGTSLQMKRGRRPCMNGLGISLPNNNLIFRASNQKEKGRSYLHKYMQTSPNMATITKHPKTETTSITSDISERSRVSMGRARTGSPWAGKTCVLEHCFWQSSRDNSRLIRKWRSAPEFNMRGVFFGYVLHGSQ